MRIEIQDDVAYNTLLKQEWRSASLPLFSQFFSIVRKSYAFSIEETAAFLNVEPEIIIKLENGQIWGSVNYVNLAAAETFFNLKKGCLKRILRQTLIVD